MVYVAYVIYVVYDMYVSYVFLSRNLPFLLFSCLKKQAPAMRPETCCILWRGYCHFAAGAAAAGAAGASGAAAADAGW